MKIRNKIYAYQGVLRKAIRVVMRSAISIISAPNSNGCRVKGRIKPVNRSRVETRVGSIGIGVKPMIYVIKVIRLIRHNTIL